MKLFVYRTKVITNVYINFHGRLCPPLLPIEQKKLHRLKITLSYISWVHCSKLELKYKNNLKILIHIICFKTKYLCNLAHLPMLQLDQRRFFCHVKNVTNDSSTLKAWRDFLWYLLIVNKDFLLFSYIYKKCANCNLISLKLQPRSTNYLYLRWL